MFLIGVYGFKVSENICFVVSGAFFLGERHAGGFFQTQYMPCRPCRTET